MSAYTRFELDPEDILDALRISTNSISGIPSMTNVAADAAADPSPAGKSS